MAALDSVLEGRNLIAVLVRDAQDVPLLAHLAIVAGALVLGWLGARMLRPLILRLTAGAAGGPRSGASEFEPVVMPVLVWLLLVCGRAVARHWTATPLLDIAVPLASSFTVIRIAVHMLRYALPPGSWVTGSERAIGLVMWIGVGLHITGVLPELRRVLDEIALPVGHHQISVLNVLEGTVSVIVTMLAVLWLGRIAERRLMALGRVDGNVRVVLSKLVKAVLIVVGVLTALALVGIDITVLSVFGGALGVGLGFGLQKIAANYVSGFALLLDRSVKLGDIVTVDSKYGEVSRLTARYVVLRSPDGSESIIPNETVITSTVVNHSYSDRKVRVDSAIQVGYGSDLRRTLRIIEAAAARTSRVEPAPPPLAIVAGFGDSGINVQFFAWIADPEAGVGNVRSELNMSVYEALRAEGVEIPFPQREVRMLGPGGARDPIKD